MAKMPCDIRTSKMILLSIKLGIPSTMIDIASQFCSQKDFFIMEKKRDNIEDFLHHFIKYDEGYANDYLLRLRIFNDWRQKFFDGFKHE